MAALAARLAAVINEFGGLGGAGEARRRADTAEQRTAEAEAALEAAEREVRVCDARV